MSPIFEPRSDGNKLTVTKGSTLKGLAPGVSLDDVGRYNWGTKDKHEINRALVELVGCDEVNEGDPLASKLNPELGTRGDVHKPVPWNPESKPYDFDKTLTVKLKKRLPMPGVAITELPSWFEPGSGTARPCTIKYRLEGLQERADRTTVEIHVTRYVDSDGVSQSSYYETIKRKRDQKREEERIAKGKPPESEADNPTEIIERPCGTDAPTDTHIWTDEQSGVGPSEVTLAWDGESKAKKGFLKPDPTAYVKPHCAPYSVLVRYFKNDADKHARIAFKESFYPKWKVERGGARTVDPASLVVKWTLENDPGDKLVLGQLQLFDKTGIVFRVGLDAAKLKGGELDLAAVWGESKFDRAKMPYRVQIQAHSGPDEANGLALAVMPTQVRAFDYTKVQFIAFDVIPPSPYNGNPDHDVDIAARCNAMIEAFENAPGTNAGENILKVFMAPEFYFRGTLGAYPVEKIETIVPLLRKKSDDIKYKDWMFVFGSAIGFQKHGAGAPVLHRSASHPFKVSDVTATSVSLKPLGTATEAITPLVGWRLAQSAVTATITKVTERIPHQHYTVEFAAGPVFTDGTGRVIVPTLDLLEARSAAPQPTRALRVKGNVCARIPGHVGGERWAIEQGPRRSFVTSVARKRRTDDEFWLLIDPPEVFNLTEPIVLIEPESTEVTNVALVQRGYPSPYMNDGSLNQAAVYKEYVSHIDYVRDRRFRWGDADASGRYITIHNQQYRAVIPTEGSQDLGSSPNVTRKPDSVVGSEINKSGIGGGVVYGMNDITWGLEVCLDHGKDRLANFYDGPDKQAAAGDPTVQVQLIPSWGMTIGGGKIWCPPNIGPVFNVDGARGDSLLRMNDKACYCDEHPRVAGVKDANCTEPMRTYRCPLAGCTWSSNAPGNCLDHPARPLRAWLTCYARRRTCNFGCDPDADVLCNHLKTRDIKRCNACGVAHANNRTCGCGAPDPQDWIETCYTDYREGSSCGQCNRNTPMRCSNQFQELGTPVAPVGNIVRVAAARDPYFPKGGGVRTWAPIDIPPPDIV